MRLFPKDAKQWKCALVRLAVVSALIVLIPVAGAFWSAWMPGRSHSEPVPQVAAEHSQLRDSLERHVQELAGTIGARSLLMSGTLDAAERYVAAALNEAGYEVSSLPFSSGKGEARNLEATLPGTTAAQEIVVVGAHYDTVVTTPGADDNASGVAVLIEAARILKTRNPARTVRFVAFPNEEPPFFRTDDMGSVRYARLCRERGDDVVAMYALESLGYFDEAPDSQMYPPPFALMYPSEGNFVGFVGSLSSRGLTHRAIALFRENIPVPSEGLAGPSWIPGVDLSDHRSFWNEGYPALMITDTALFRNPYYHKPGDVPSILDYNRLTWITLGVVAIIEDIAS